MLAFVLFSISFCIAEMLYTSISNFRICLRCFFVVAIAIVLSVWITYDKANWEIAIISWFRLNFWIALLAVPSVTLFLKLVCSFFIPYMRDRFIPIVKENEMAFRNYISYIDEERLLKKIIWILILLYILSLLKVVL